MTRARGFAAWNPKPAADAEREELVRKISALI